MAFWQLKQGASNAPQPPMTLNALFKKMLFCALVGIVFAAMGFVLYDKGHEMVGMIALLVFFETVLLNAVMMVIWTMQKAKYEKHKKA